MEQMPEQSNTSTDHVTGADDAFAANTTRRRCSSSPSWMPSLSFHPSIRHTSDAIRSISVSCIVSRLTTVVGIFPSIPALLTRLHSMAVLPTDGRAPITVIVPGIIPLVMESSRANPVGIPIMVFPPSRSACLCCTRSIHDRQTCLAVRVDAWEWCFAASSSFSNSSTIWEGSAFARIAVATAFWDARMTLRSSHDFKMPWANHWSIPGTASLARANRETEAVTPSSLPCSRSRWAIATISTGSPCASSSAIACQTCRWGSEKNASSRIPSAYASAIPSRLPMTAAIRPFSHSIECGGRLASVVAWIGSAII